MDQQPPFQTQKSSIKKWIIIGTILGVIVVAAATIVILALNKPKDAVKDNQQQAVEVSKEFTIKPGGNVVSYAGYTVYDACNLVSFDTIRKHVESYQSILDTIGTDERPTKPLVIEHNYFDRDMPAPLGKDGEMRSKGTSIGGGSGGVVPFLSSFDSNCWYGQGEGISTGGGSTFVKTYVMQKPTPINPELITYVQSLRTLGKDKGVSVYVEEGKDSAGFFTVIAVNAAKDMVAVFKTGSGEIADAAAADLVNALSEAPKGPMSVTYPRPWDDLPNTCDLISATEFERFTGKPASALAAEVVKLTEVGGGQMERSCERLEIERLGGGEISESDVLIRQAKTADEAKKYSEDIKADEFDLVAVRPVSEKIDGVDEIYVKVEGLEKPRGYQLEMRMGAKLVMINVQNETGLDASVEAYVERMLPVARLVAEKLQ